MTNQPTVATISEQISLIQSQIQLVKARIVASDKELTFAKQSGSSSGKAVIAQCEASARDIAWELDDLEAQLVGLDAQSKAQYHV